MLAKRSKMSERSQCQDEGEQRPGDERRANSGGFLQDQQSTANPNLCSAEEIKGREQMQGICMPERHHEPKLVFGRRGSRAQTMSTSLCRRGSRSGARTPGVVALKRAQTTHVRLNYKRADRRSCHEGADIAGELHLKLMAVVQKGESTPWSTDHAKWIFFRQESSSAWRQPKSRVDAIGRFRMVKKKTMIRIGRQPRLDGTTVSRRRVNSNNSWSTT